ncbi:hypothetical protein [Natronosalvus amylolyticus]|uniref:hypothetical protein n=1 Tax=Natronosalvus amylolyticus TaxID=2961994 RepID=UPI0020C96981|nr:hypothetical protein [Natronosalvus amylolyticus]
MPEQTEISDQNNNGSDDNPDTDTAYDIETYRHALQEAGRTLDQQLEAFNDVADKAWRIVQLNGIIGTVYIAAVANALPSLSITYLSGGFIAVGLICFGISVYLATEGQEAQTVVIGQSSDSFRSIRSTDPSEIEYLYKTLEDYEGWIDRVNVKTEINGDTVNKAKRALIAGVVFIILGTLIAVVV